jgi:membrane protein YdbS with pleckstrin-like domain
MKKEIFEKISSLVIAAFGLVAALAWNGAIQSIFKEIFGTPDGIWSMLTYAIVVTAIAVIVTVWVAKASQRKQ